MFGRKRKDPDATPPEGPVIAAGISSTTPAVAQLLGVVARLPQGMVVLPGVDLTSPKAEWDALGPHEPLQYRAADRVDGRARLGRCRRMGDPG